MIIVLTALDSNEPVYVNSNYIVEFHRDDVTGGTKILMGVNGRAVCYVKEHPGDVMKMLEGVS